MAVKFDIEGELGSIVIDHQEKLNALDLESFRELERIVRAVRVDPHVRGLMIVAEGGRAFSSGADIKDLAGLDASEACARATYRRAVLQALTELPVPTIAVVEALAMGGGVELALACTFRLASPQARFSFPEIKLGLFPGAGGTQRLPRIVGESRALEMMLTARVIDASEAYRIGLVDRVTVDPRAEARVLASQWLPFSRQAIAAIIAAVRCAELPIDEGLAAEGRHLAALNTSADAAEGIAAFMEKRAPRFNQA